MSYPKTLASLIADRAYVEASFSDYHDRRISPGETFAAIRPFFRDLGITRVGMLTGLDTLNIPVAFATRPNSFTLSVFQGKGIDADAAMASAAMEALETRIAELQPKDLVLSSVTDLTSSGRRMIDLDSTARCVPDEIGNGDIPWSVGLDLISGEPTYLPWSLVGMDHRGERPSGFEQSSDGLASGNSPSEALLHGLCELVERDAWALMQLQSDESLASRLIDPRSLQDAVLDIILDRIAAAGMSLALVDMTTDLAVPAFFAVLVPAATGKRVDPSWSQICGGCGCHPNPIRAALRAITEAAQSRLTAIAGSRDDFSPRIYQRMGASDAMRTLAGLSSVRASAYQGKTFCEQPFSINQTIDHIVGRLTSCGINQVIAVPLQDEGLPVSVMRVIVPGLEVDLVGDNIQLGIRAATALKRARH